MAFEILKNAVFEVSGKRKKLEQDLVGRTNHIQSIRAFSSHQTRLADGKIIDQQTTKIAEIRAELESHRSK